MPRILVSSVATVWILSLLAGCASGPQTVARAQTLMGEGKLSQACGILSGLVGEEQPAQARLKATRLWVDCLNRMGQLSRARARLSTLPPSPARLYAQALELLARSPADLPRVVGLLDQAAQQWPQQGEIPFRAGLLLLADEQAGKALPFLERACPLAQTAACSVALAHAQLDLGRMDQALDSVRKVPGLKPRPQDIKRGKALIQRVQRRARIVPRQVREQFRKALGLLHNEDKAGECINVVELILQDHPRLAAAHTLLGLAQVRLDNGAEAIVALRRAAELNPVDATNHYYMGLIYRQRRHTDKSIASFRQALRLDPFLERGARSLGELLLETSRPKEAAQVLDQLVQVDGGSPISLRFAGRAHLAARQLKRAEDCFTRLWQREPKDFELNLRLAQILMQRHAKQGGRPASLLQRAARHVERASATRPKDPDLLRLRARIEAEK